MSKKEASSDDDDSKRPIIIIKKVKKVAGGHHGGAWKVAYADFVTAMMAFFLLMWLLNATTEEQRLGIAEYFSPVSTSTSTSGSGGVLGGQTILAPGTMQTVTSPPAPIQQNVPEPPSELLEDQEGETPNQVDEKTVDKLIEQREEQLFRETEQELRQAIESTPELQALQNSLIVDRTPEGLRIQIVDQDKLSMFPLGSAQMYDHTRQLIELVVRVVQKMPNKISISGHTDGTPYSAGAEYTNWELSVDRANASRRAMINAGLKTDRISYVRGKADRDHLFPQQAESPRNRRISIVLLKDAK